MIAACYLDILHCLMDRSMSPAALRRFLLAGIPAALIVAVALSAIFGPAGVVRRDALHVELEQATEALADLERENRAIILELSTLERDPVAIERAVADEIGYAAEGSTLYRFD